MCRRCHLGDASDYLGPRFDRRRGNLRNVSFLLQLLVMRALNELTNITDNGQLFPRFESS